MKKTTPLKLTSWIELFLNKSVALGLTSQRDNIYLRNQIYLLLSIETTPLPEDTSLFADNSTLAQLAERIYLALDGNQAATLGASKEQIETRLINILLPLPSTIETGFKQRLAAHGIKNALDWYYQFSQNTNYIKTADIAKNQSWSSQTKFGELDITINLSKPEKDPLEIAKAKLIKPSANLYPKCLLCIENEGYAGSFNQPARHNHRMLELQLNGKPWYFQYSPYAYSLIRNTAIC
jgi:UDPglucose--hexose-1-phosphate uridylyltransferase